MNSILLQTTLHCRVLACAILAVMLVSSLVSASPAIRGQVIDKSGEPVIGASVAVIIDGRIITGASTDTTGQFSIPFELSTDKSTLVRVTALGFDSSLFTLTTTDKQYRIALQEKDVELQTIRVTPNADPFEQAINRHRLEQDARQSIISTNPLNSLKEPQLVRRGSVHSSTLRINGTSPQYFINGISMGADPNHYGLFSILPISVVDKVRFYPQGTSAKYGLPSVVELDTPERFGHASGGDLYLSLLEGTGSYWYGDKRFFALASMRQSVVDQVVDKFGTTEKGNSIPPTKFRDLFASTGYKTGNASTVYLDGYSVTDNLKYERAPSYNDPGIESYVQTDRQYVGVRHQALIKGTVSLTSGLAFTHNDELYAVNGWKDSPSNVFGELHEQTETVNAHSGTEFVYANRKFSIGLESEWVVSRNTDLAQHNWNFLPPDATTDNPFVYTPELNELFGSYEHHASAQNSAVYFSVSQQFGRLTVESGVRAHSFSELGDNSAVALRQRFSVDMGNKTTAELFLGTFAENPINKILESYQVLTRASAAYLEPVTTYLASLHLSHKAVRGSIFMKEIDRYPTLTPDFNRVSYENNTPRAESGFLTMRSNGTLAFTGADISLDLQNIVPKKLDLYTYYSYTEATKQIHGIETPYDLNSPHRFLLDATWHISKSFTTGSTLQIRTGYPYSPDHSNYIVLPANTENRYSEAYYKSYLKNENSLSFPVNAALNLHCSFEFGKSALYCSVSNVTNRSNPVVFTGRKYIYDLGIFPSIGFSTEF